LLNVQGAIFQLFSGGEHILKYINICIEMREEMGQGGQRLLTATEKKYGELG
jgi:hypothetical protein